MENLENVVEVAEEAVKVGAKAKLNWKVIAIGVGATVVLGVAGFFGVKAIKAKKAAKAIAAAEATEATESEEE